MSEDTQPVKPDWRELRREKRTEVRTINLIQRLYRALLLVKSDAEKEGFTYGRQSACQKALDEYVKWERDRQARLKNPAISEQDP